MPPSQPPPQQFQHHQHHQDQLQRNLLRKHHSPYHSRHASPHSHHSSHHSQHSSPHQSHAHVHECNGSSTRRSSVDSPARNHHHHNHITSNTNTNTNTNSSHSSHHHHVHRRRKRPSSNHHHANGTHSANSSGSHGAHSVRHGRSSAASYTNHNDRSGCSRRHRSATDVSSTSIYTCHEALCDDQEVQEILVHKSCCTSSRAELAQYFAEDLYGSSRRPSSCCTSSDYCYHTDSTSLYGSRSSLSRNNSIKSASIAMRKKRVQQRQPGLTSISLRGINTSHPGSLTSLFDRAKQIADKGGFAETAAGKVVVSPSKVTIERHSSSNDALDKELPEYACSPSPIRWSFLADGKSPTEFDGAVGESPAEHRACNTEYRRGSCSSERQQRQADRSEAHPPASSLRKCKFVYDEQTGTLTGSRRCRDSPFSCDFEESTTVLFHQEGEAFNNACNNYVQCNTYLDQDLQITSEDIHQYLSKGNQRIGDILNNSKTYPFQPSNALEFQYKNNFANNNAVASSTGGDSSQSDHDCRVRRNSCKETNLNQNMEFEAGACVAMASSSCASTPLLPADINLSASTNNINISFNTYAGTGTASEVKFINTTRQNTVSAEAHHSGYLPYTYPSYDYTNMSANSLFDKPIGIDAIPSSADLTTSPSATATDGQHSSALQSPIPNVFDRNVFDSFDAASHNNLLSQRSSFRYSPTTARSPASPSATSSISASVDPACRYHYYQREGGRRDRRLPSPSPSLTHHPCHHDSYRHPNHRHCTEGFKFSNALRRMRKRARKYTDFLRKK